MKSLLNSQDKAEIFERLQRLKHDSPRYWGRMTAAQMICHLTDSFQAKFGERPVSSVENWFTRSVMKWAALQLPLPWLHGVKTMPEMDQEIGGTPPADFERDRQRLEQMLERFTQPAKETDMHPHPYFGRMSEAEWMRWGYLHCDHHLRQFGV